MISRKQKNNCKTLNYIKHLLISVTAITVCIWISAFAYLPAIPIGITSFAIVLKIWAKTAGIKKYKSIMKKKEA